MPMLVLCPTCGVELQIPDASVGGNVACPKCSAEMAIPHPPTVAPSRPASVPGVPPAFANPIASRRDRGHDVDDDDRPSRKKSSRRSQRDEDDGDAEDDRGRMRRSDRGFQCPYCASRDLPMTQSRISQGGWIVFALMILFCFPLFFIGLLMKEDFQVCSDCGIKLGG